MRTLDERLDAARTGDARAVQPLFRTNPDRLALYAAWIESAPRDGRQNARDALAGLAAQRPGLARSLKALVSPGSDAAIASRVGSKARREAAVERLAQAFVALDPGPREVLLLRDLEHLTEAAAAEKLVVSVEVLRQRLGRARDLLRGRMAILARG